MAGVCARARVWAAWGYSGKILSRGARHVVLRALRTGIFVLSKKYTAPPLTLDVVAEVVMAVWRCWLGCLVLFWRFRPLHREVSFDVFAVHLGMVALGDDFASG